MKGTKSIQLHIFHRVLGEIFLIIIKKNIKNGLKIVLTQNLIIIGECCRIMNSINSNKKYLSLFKETMKQLGFKELQIKYALQNIKINENIEQCVEDAIKLIALKNKFDKECKEIN